MLLTRWKSTSLLAVALNIGIIFPVFAVDLAGVHDIAVKQDPQLRAAALRRDASDFETDIAWANFYPQISGSVQRTFGSTELEIQGIPDLGIPDINTLNDIDTENYRVELRQSVFNWRNYAELDQARARISVAAADYDAAYQDFLLRVSESYFAVLTSRDSLTFAKAEAKALERQYDQAEQRFEVGLTAVTDVLDARATFDDARARVIAAENALDDAHEGLRELTGTYFEVLNVLSQELPLVKPDPITPKQWVDIAMSNNPALLSSRQTADVSESNVRLQKSAFFPTVDLVASFNQNANNANAFRNDNLDIIATGLVINNQTQVQLQLNVPIFTGFRTTALTRQAKANLNAAFEDVEQQERSTLRLVENAFRSVLADIEEVQAREQAVISARGALDATQAGFEVGTRTIVDVLLSEQRFFQAQRDFSSARHNYILDHLRLKQAAGVLQAEDLVRVNSLLQLSQEDIEPSAEEVIDAAAMESTDN